MSDLNWHKAQATTLEYLRNKYSHGDLVFAGFTLTGVLDGVLHISGFPIRPGEMADIFILFKEIHSITQHGQVTHPTFSYNIETLDPSLSLKRLTLQYDSGRTLIDYRDDLLYLCRCSGGEYERL